MRRASPSRRMAFLDLAAARPSTADRGNLHGVKWSVLSGLGVIILAFAAWRGDWRVVLAASVGALGGFSHELMQSSGWFFFPQTTKTGMRYLGAAAGLALGAVAGVLAVQTLVTTLPAAGTLTGPGTAWSYQLAYTAFAAGLGLKGLTEAATTDVEKP